MNAPDSTPQGADSTEPLPTPAPADPPEPRNDAPTDEAQPTATPKAEPEVLSEQSESKDATNEAPVESQAEPNDASDAPVETHDAPSEPKAEPEVVSEQSESKDATTEAPVESQAEPNDTSDAPAESQAEPKDAPDAPAEATTTPDAKPKKKNRKPKKRRPPPPRRPELPPCPPAFLEEAAAAARADWLTKAGGDPKVLERALDLLRSGKSLAYLARFRRPDTKGMDERRLRTLRDGYNEIRVREERRIAIRELLKQHGAWDDDVAARLAAAPSASDMEDLAAPHMPVLASRAFMARSLGLQALAHAIRNATEAQPLSELAQPFVKEGGEPATLDEALGGARDILAEEVSLDPTLRQRLRNLFRREARVSVSARTEKRPDGGAPASKGWSRAQALIGFEQAASKVPPMKMLAIRSAEKIRAIVTNIEPSEAKALTIVNDVVVRQGHVHAGFLRAAAEDGYRRILKPLLQNELRLELKGKADASVMENFERNLRHALLGPRAGPVVTMGLRPDVAQGHRWCAIDGQALPTGCGQLPHEATAGREACLAELAQVLQTYEVRAVAVGTSGGRAAAVSLVREATAGKNILVAEVSDGGTRALEGMDKLEIDERPVVPPEARGALSLARRFQDPMAELVQIDPKALALGPHIRDVHAGHLRTLVDDVITSCVAHVGVDPSTASEDLMVRVPGFTRQAAKAFIEWRKYNNLESKAALAAVEGVGPEIAEQAVGFLRIPSSTDPRDRTQLHPQQYDLAQRMADQVGENLETLFSDSGVRQRVNLSALTDKQTPLPMLKHVLYEVSVGDRDPRPMMSEPIPPPPSITLETLQPGLTLQGRVVRAAPFGLFVDVGLGIEGLIPLPHIGDRPGVEPATIAPVGAVIDAQVLDCDPKKKRLTLSMRSAPPAPPVRGPRRREGGPSRGPRTGERRAGSAGGRPERAGAGAGAGPRSAGGRAPSRGTGAPRGEGAAARGQGGRGQSGRGQSGRGQSGRGQTGRGQTGRGQGPRKPGGFDRGAGYSSGRGRDRNPRKISLGPGPSEPDAEVIDESLLSPEELMKRKLEQLQRKLQRPDA